MRGLTLLVAIFQKPLYRLAILKYGMKLLDFSARLKFHLAVMLVRLLGEMHLLVENKVCTDIHACILVIPDFSSCEVNSRKCDCTC